jgi:putative flippase GtrA
VKSPVRWLVFNAVGVLGAIVQLAVLHGALALANMHYATATVLAVEAAVLHNFVWHERWTWRDRPPGAAFRLTRLALFHAANGAVSLGGNLLVMRLLVEGGGFPAVPANLVAILTCAAINFWIGDHVVFRARRDRSGIALRVLP